MDNKQRFKTCECYENSLLLEQQQQQQQKNPEK